MKILCLLLSIVIQCVGCADTLPSSESTSEISGEDSNKAIVMSGNSETNTADSTPPDKSIQESSPSLISKDDVEQLFNSVYKPILLSLPESLSDGDKLTPQQAYECFQYFAIFHYTPYSKRAELFTKIDDVAYYPKDIVETFVGDNFDISAEDMRTGESYSNDALGYAETIYGGVDKNTVNILDIKETNGVWSISFDYTNIYATTTTLGDISFREKDSHLVLSSFKMKKADK